MPCHTSTAGVEPTITQVEYHCKQRNEIILFLFRYRQAEAQDAHAALARDRSMRGERRGFLLGRGLLGRGRCGGRGLVPLDRLQLARHRAGEHLVHARDRNDVEAFLDAVADLHEVLGVLFGNEHCFDAPAQGREQLLLETGDPRPRSVISPVTATSRRTGMPVITETIAVAMATPAEGPSFGVAPSGTCAWMS